MESAKWVGRLLEILGVDVMAEGVSDGTHLEEMEGDSSRL